MTTLVMTITVADAGWRFTVAWTHELLQFIYPSTLFNIIIISISEMRKLWHRVSRVTSTRKGDKERGGQGGPRPFPAPASGRSGHTLGGQGSCRCRHLRKNHTPIPLVS